MTKQNDIEILIVEDSLTQSLRLQHLLEKNGFRVRTARDGRRALESLEVHRPTLVIADIQMPEMDGYQLCRAVKSTPALRDVPVMLLTSLSAPQDIIRGLESGADNFVVKPYEEDFLLSRIETVLASQQFRKTGGAEAELPILFAGKKYTISSDRRQILNLLLSTYETAVKTNLDLIQAHEELKSAQAQLIEAEKALSLGRLAAGVAHEVRNPLAILEMGVSFLSERSLGEEERGVLNEMCEAVRRANIVIHGLMDVSSPNELGMRDSDINRVIEKALLLFADQLDQRKIKVRRELQPDLCACRIDESKMEQVFINLFANARDAMPNGGELLIHTQTRVLDKSDVTYDAGDRSGARLREGDHGVLVEISDSGAGIAGDNLTKVFDPFFSTKPTGKGMGLGLTVSKKMIELHGGKLALRNRPEGGITATVLLRCIGQA